MSKIKDQEIVTCQEKIMELELHLANKDKKVNVLRNIKIKLEDRVEELENEIAKLRGA